MTASRREAVAVAPRHEWIVRAWKWGAGSLSAGAALVSILSSVRSITGCGLPSRSRTTDASVYQDGTTGLPHQSRRWLSCC